MSIQARAARPVDRVLIARRSSRRAREPLREFAALAAAPPPSTDRTLPPALLALVCAALFAALFALLGFASPARAHHSGSMFDRQQPKTLTGTVREFQWTNPHCYVQLLVRTDKGEMQEWSLEMGAPQHVYASGWRPKTLKPGDKITVTVFPLRAGGNGGEIQTALTADGKKLGR